jgi:polysaccharide pyruvyl transferase WcaK-like protein
MGIATLRNGDETRRTEPFGRSSDARSGVRGRRQVIGLLGRFGQGNFGNDGSLEAMVDFLRRARPQAELVCICSGRDVVERDFGLSTVPINWPRPANPTLRAIDAALLRAPSILHHLIQKIKNTRRMDAIIVPGTGILDDFGETPLGTPATLFLWCLAARLCGTKFAFVSIGAGPIHHPLSRRLFKAAARMAQYRSYRDPISKQFMDGIGFDTRNDPLFPDIAFALPRPEIHDQPPAGARPLRVGVGLMTYYGWRGDPVSGAQIHEKYMVQITRFVRWLLDSGHQVRLLMGDSGDKPVIERVLISVADGMPESLRGRLIAEDAQSLQDIMRQISDTDVVVATRFHNVVCALKMNRPTISLGYARKNDVLLADMGLGEFCQSIEQLDLDLLNKQFTKLVADREKYVKGIEAANAKYERELQRQGELLLSKFL